MPRSNHIETSVPQIKPFLVDQKVFSARLDEFYQLANQSDLAPELAIVKEIDRVSGNIGGFPEAMENLNALIRALHSFQPLVPALEATWNIKHEQQVLKSLNVTTEKAITFGAVLEQARPEPLCGVVLALPDCFLELDLPDFECLQSFWKDNSRYLHPLILASELLNHTKLGKDDPRARLIQLEAFRQVGVPLVLDLPASVVAGLENENFDDNLETLFGQTMVYCYENTRTMIASILTKGPNAHQGTGNGFIAFIAR